jgi:putative DNA-invertase from lambdoid prophage Rac
MTRVAIYARVSTADQSTEIQVRDLRAYAERQGWAVSPGHVFVDEGVSGAKDNRPGLDRLRRAVFIGEVDVLLVTAPDRLGRNVVAGLLFVQDLAARGVRLVVLSLGLDTSSPTGRMALTVMLAFAEWERTLILSRTAAGIARARAAGKRFGRPPKLTADQRAETVLRLSNGESSRAVSQALKIPASTVRWIGRQARAESPPGSGPAQATPPPARPSRGT